MSFICTAKIELSTCRLVDLLSTTTTVNNKDPVRARVRFRFRVRFRAGLGLGLTVDIQIGTIMTINEDPSPNLIGRQVDKSTIQFWQYR